MSVPGERHGARSRQRERFVVRGALRRGQSDDEPQRLQEQLPVLLDRFLSAAGRPVRTDEEVSFDVERCRFVELLGAVGEPQLAPLLCEADELFFDGRRRLVRLRRTGTLAQGAARCDLRFDT